MMDTIIRKIEEREGEATRDFILKLFKSHLFADYSEEGREIVAEYVSTESLVQTNKENFTFLAEISKKVVGVVKVKRGNHVSMLFVDEQFHGKGIGRRLLEYAKNECVSRQPELTELTANSSRFALPFFESRGFTPTGIENTTNGIVYTPMRLDLSTDSQKI